MALNENAAVLWQIWNGRVEPGGSREIDQGTRNLIRGFEVEYADLETERPQSVERGQREDDGENEDGVVRPRE